MIDGLNHRWGSMRPSPSRRLVGVVLAAAVGLPLGDTRRRWATGWAGRLPAAVLAAVLAFVLLDVLMAVGVSRLGREDQGRLPRGIRGVDDLALGGLDGGLHLGLVVQLAGVQHHVTGLHRGPLHRAQVQVVRVLSALVEQLHLGVRGHLPGDPGQRVDGGDDLEVCPELRRTGRGLGRNHGSGSALQPATSTSPRTSAGQKGRMRESPELGRRARA
jgi:hypothetical protein